MRGKKDIVLLVSGSQTGIVLLVSGNQAGMVLIYVSIVLE